MTVSNRADKPIALYFSLVVLAAIAYVGTLLVLRPSFGNVIAQAAAFFSVAMIGYKPANDFSKARGRSLSFIAWFFVWATACAGVGIAETIVARSVAGVFS